MALVLRILSKRVKSNMLNLFRTKTFLREFHISDDLLAVYTIEENTLKLIRIGSHSEIFN